MRDFKKEVLTIEKLAQQRSGDGAGEIAARIMGKTRSGADHVGFSFYDNQADARTIRDSGRSFLSVYSVVRRYLASKTDTVAA